MVCKKIKLVPLLLSYVRALQLKRLLCHTESHYCKRAVNYPNRTYNHIESYVLTILDTTVLQTCMNKSNYYNALQDH